MSTNFQQQFPSAHLYAICATTCTGLCLSRRVSCCMTTCLQVFGPAPQLFTALQPSSLLAAKFGSISDPDAAAPTVTVRHTAAAALPTALTPMVTLRRTAAAASRRVSAAGGAGRAVLQGLKPKLWPKWAVPRSLAADAAFQPAASWDAKDAAAPESIAWADSTGRHGGVLRHSPEPAASPPAGLSDAAASGSPSAGSSTNSVAAVVVQLQQQMAALHDEVAALRRSLMGLSGGPVAEEVRVTWAQPHCNDCGSITTARAVVQAIGSGQRIFLPKFRPLLLCSVTSHCQ